MLLGLEALGVFMPGRISPFLRRSKRDIHLPEIDPVEGPMIAALRRFRRLVLTNAVV
jgi:hypothetical protein